jgi:hypothetical protein
MNIAVVSIASTVTLANFNLNSSYSGKRVAGTECIQASSGIKVMHEAKTNRPPLLAPLIEV